MLKDVAFTAAMLLNHKNVVSHQHEIAPVVRRKVDITIPETNKSEIDIAPPQHLNVELTTKPSDPVNECRNLGTFGMHYDISTNTWTCMWVDY